MTKEKELTVTNFTSIFTTLPLTEQGYLLGRMEGYKIGYAEAKKENKNEKN